MADSMSRRRLQFRIGHQRQVDQVLDRTPVQGLPDRLVFSLDLLPESGVAAGRCRTGAGR